MKRSVRVQGRKTHSIITTNYVDIYEVHNVHNLNN